MRHSLVVVGFFFAGCTAAGVEPPPTAEQAARPEAVEPEAPPPLEEADYEPTFGPRVEQEAIYAVSPRAGGKRLQEGALYLPAGEAWICSYRPVPDYYAFQDKRVIATGRTYTNSPYVQSVTGTHFEIESLRLAEGETPHDPVPTTLLAPPHVKSIAELQARKRLWAHVVGVIEVHEGEDRWRDGTLTMRDETIAITGHIDVLSGVAGEPATLLVRVLDEPGTTGPKLAVLESCLGVVDECGVDRPEDRARGRK